MATFSHTLDYNGLYRLELDYNAAGQQLRVHLTEEGEPWPRLQAAIMGQLGLKTSDGRSIHAYPTKDRKSITFSPVPADFILRLGEEPIGTFKAGGDGLTETNQRLLTSTETRRIGTFHKQGPYAQRPQDKALIEKAKKAVFTDFHTHSSGQISAAGMLKVAIEHDIYYPLELLREAGIDTSRHHVGATKMVKRVVFPPLERPGLPDQIEAASLKALTPEDIKKLARRMNMPADRQSTYTEMEYDAYRFRYPLSKEKSILKESLKQVAREYAAQGIHYAEIAFAGLENPELFRTLHEAMREIENDPETKDVALRFMVGIPRTWSEAKIEEVLHKTRILTQSPYIVGVDLIGYEANKTANFNRVLHEFASWANTNRPGFTLRAHAGENDKNLENVSDFLKLASEFPKLRARIGHGVYGMDDQTMALASQLLNDPHNPRLWFEFNPASNVALNNLDDVRMVPFDRAKKAKIPFIVGSDSSGIYQTTAEQLGLDAYYAGLDDAGFEQLRASQSKLMQFQLGYSFGIGTQHPEWKSVEGTNKMLSRIEQELGTVKKAPQSTPERPSREAIEAKLRAERVVLVEPGHHPPELKGKTPVALIGASGKSWQRIEPKEQREIEVMTDMIIHALDPEKAYIVQGRLKSVGLSRAVNQALDHSNSDNEPRNRRPFYTLGILAEPRFDEANSHGHLTHIEEILGGRLDIADGIVNHTLGHNGVLIGAGGAAFTRDIILKADQRGMLDSGNGNRKMMLLMSGPKGASTEKAAVLDPAYKAEGAKEVIRKLFNERKDLFVPNFKIGSLDRYYDDSQKRVASYEHETPDSDGQLPIEGVTRGPDRKR